MTYAITVIRKDGDTHKYVLSPDVARLLTDVLIAHREYGYRDGWSRIRNDDGYVVLTETGEAPNDFNSVLR